MTKIIKKEICFRIVLLMLLASALSPAFSFTSEAAAATYTATSSDQGWKKTGKKYSYLRSNGSMVKGWLKIGTKVYFIAENGYRVTGWQQIDGAYYYFKSNGRQKTKWLTVGKKKYYLAAKNNGARVTGLKKIGKYYYYFSKKGVMKTGWVKLNSKFYFFGSNGRRQTGWITSGGKTYYADPSTAARVSGTVILNGEYYLFNENGVYMQKIPKHTGGWYGPDGKKLYTSTIKNLLKTALKPVGSTMYVWGGGWSATVAGGDITARTIGVSPAWRAFYQKQTASYDYNKTRLQYKNGLDCSGYVGWVIYNTFNRVSGHAGYVMLAQQQARTFSSYGWGSYTLASSVAGFKPGDIMSTPEGHVYIVVGSCSDGSIVLLHSSPKGVMISGTANKKGNMNSKAVALATKYMKTYYPAWYKKYPEVSRGKSYLTNYNQMRWYITSTSIMSDPDRYLSKDAAAVLKDLFA